MVEKMITFFGKTKQRSGSAVKTSSSKNFGKRWKTRARESF